MRELKESFLKGGQFFIDFTFTILIAFVLYIDFLDFYGVFINNLSLLFLSDYWELFLFWMEGNLTLGSFYWLFAFMPFRDLGIKKLLFYFYIGANILLLLVDKSPFYFYLLYAFEDWLLYLFIDFGGSGTKLTHLCYDSGKTIVSRRL